MGNSMFKCLRGKGWFKRLSVPSLSSLPISSIKSSITLLSLSTSFWELWVRFHPNTPPEFWKITKLWIIFGWLLRIFTVLILELEKTMLMNKLLWILLKFYSKFIRETANFSKTKTFNPLLVLGREDWFLKLWNSLMGIFVSSQKTILKKLELLLWNSLNI